MNRDEYSGISDSDHIADLITGMRRNRATIQRRRVSLTDAFEHQKRYIRQALNMGMPPKQVARNTGLTAGRISQIRHEGGEPVSLFDLM